MKQALDIVELAGRIQAQQESKEDYIASTRDLTLMTSTAVELEGEWDLKPIGSSQLQVGGEGTYDVLPLAHDQIGQHLGIPKAFYDRLRVGKPAVKNGSGARQPNPALLDHTVNTLLRAEPKPRMIRTLDGKARSFNSNRFRRLDNFDLAEAIFPIIGEMDSPLVSGEVTDLRLYLKVILPKIEAIVPKVGDVVQAGFLIQNSEVGLGAMSVQPLIYTLACLNGMVVPKFGMRAYHVGRISEELDAAYRVYRDETVQADDRAFWLKAQDVVRAAADEAVFADIVAHLGEAASTEPMEDVQVGVERLAKKVSLSEGESRSVLQHLAQGGNLTLYGLANALTAAAQEMESYDRSVELEAIGGQVVLMPRNEWKALASV